VRFESVLRQKVIQSKIKITGLNWMTITILQKSDPIQIHVVRFGSDFGYPKRNMQFKTNVYGVAISTLSVDLGLTN